MFGPHSLRCGCSHSFRSKIWNPTRQKLNRYHTFLILLHYYHTSSICHTIFGGGKNRSHLDIWNFLAQNLKKKEYISMCLLRIFVTYIIFMFWDITEINDIFLWVCYSICLLTVRRFEAFRVQFWISFCLNYACTFLFYLFVYLFERKCFFRTLERIHTYIKSSAKLVIDNIFSLKIKLYVFYMWPN